VPLKRDHLGIDVDPVLGILRLNGLRVLAGKEATLS
jgi:hypothetical protein